MNIEKLECEKNVVTRKRSPRRAIGRKPTREGLIEGAFRLLDGDKSLDGLSQRELTREVGIVPTAFYRHFKDMDELALELVADAFREVREILEQVQGLSQPDDKRIRSLLKALVKQITEKRLRFRFIVSERHGGLAAVRLEIRRELQLLQSDLATDLARFPVLNQWPTRDLHMLASLIFNAMAAVVEEMLDQPKRDGGRQKELLELAERQLRLILLAVPQWNFE